MWDLNILNDLNLILYYLHFTRRPNLLEKEGCIFIFQYVVVESKILVNGYRSTFSTVLAVSDEEEELVSSFICVDMMKSSK